MSAVAIGFLAAGATVCKGVEVFCQKANPLTTSATGKVAYAVGQQVAHNLGMLCAWGVVAQKSEFSTVQSAESAFVSNTGTLPPIT